MDVITMLDYAFSRHLYERPKCILEALVTGDQIPVFEDNELVMGMSIILLSLTRFEGFMRWAVTTEDFGIEIENAVESLWDLGVFMPNLLSPH